MSPYADHMERLVYGRRYYRLNRKRLLAQSIAYGKSAHGRALIDARRVQPAKRLRHLALQARRRAAIAGQEFEAGVFDLAVYPALNCACCSKVLDYSVGRGRGRHWDSPSLDRVDNAKGYTVANTRVICMRCNADKRDLSVVVARRLLAYMERQ